MTISYQTDTLYKNYLRQVKRSGILEPVGPVRSSRGKSLQSVLSSSRSLARREFVRVHKEMDALFKQIREIEKSIKTDIIEIESKYPTYKNTWHAVFEEFDHNLGKIFDYAHHSLISSFDKKVRRMDNFTTCLFGKTKAGKSTTMEALTGGKGQTIGLGRQNTTLRAQEYEWNGMVVIDTPGIDAMFECHELETTALEYADCSDLILFLMSHRIDEVDFIQFSRFYKQNKPIVILLNVKEDTGKPGSEDFDDFLEYSTQQLFTEADISGYRQRIDTFIFKELRIPKGLVPIIPVHSLSAFLAKCKHNGVSTQVRKKLYDISRFGDLEAKIVAEVRSFGELYRIKNPYDTILLFSKEIMEQFNAFSSLMEKQRDVFSVNAQKFAQVVGKIRHQRHTIVDNVLGRYFRSKRSSAGSVVNDLFESKDEYKQREILQDFMPEKEVLDRIDEVQQPIQAMIEKEITDFFRSIEQQLKDIGVELHKEQVRRAAKHDMAEIDAIGSTGSLLEGFGVASGVVSGLVLAISGSAFLGEVGTILGIGSANIWNPVGWGLMAVGIVLGIWGWSKRKEMQEKVRQAKADATAKLQEAVDKAEQTVIVKINRWVDDVLKKIQDEHVDVMIQYVQYAEKHLRQVALLVEWLDGLNVEMRRSKFESMVRRYTGDNSINVGEVVEVPDAIGVRVQSGAVKQVHQMEADLSRVEEKPIKIMVKAL